MFFYIYTPSLSNLPIVRPLKFSRLMAQMTRTHARVCLFAFVDIAAHLGDQIAPKP